MNNEWYNSLPLLRNPRFRQSFLSVFGFGLLAHAYSYFALYHSHDSLYCLNRTDIAVHISYGRFMQPVYFTLRGNLSVPWLLGILALLWIALSVYLLTGMFQVRESVSVVLIGGLMSTGTMLAATNATYFSFTDIFMLGFLLAAVAVWMTDRWKWGFVPGAVCMMLSLGLYQCFIGAACGLLIMLFIYKLFRKEPFSQLCLLALRGAAMLLLGGLVYKLTLEVVLKATGVSLANTYNGLQGLGDYYGFSRMKLIVGAYRYVFDSFLNPQTWHPAAGAAATVVLLLTGLACLGALLGHARAQWWRYALALAAVVVLPFAVNITYFVSKGMVHELMIYQFLLIPVFAVMLADCWTVEKEGASVKWLRGAVLTTVLVTVGLSAIYANGAYLQKQLQFEATESAVNRIIAAMEDHEEYTAGETPVVFAGEMTASGAFRSRPGFESYRAVGMFTDSVITFWETENDFLTQVMGYPVNWVDRDTDAVIETSDVVKMMPAFPKKGYCQMMDGVMVVKLSEIEE